MLSRVATSVLRQARPIAYRQATGFAKPSVISVGNTTFSRRSFSSVSEAKNADDAWKKSCYVEIDYTINDESTVYDMVQRFAAFNIGCLVTVDDAGNITGIVSERDYVSKIALLGRTSKETKVKEISTKSSNLITASPEDSVEECMQMMLSKDIRHLPLVDADKKIVGMISIKDIVKILLDQKEETIKVLSNFALGRGGHFGSE